MGKLDLLTGRKILEEAESPINGKLTVIRDLAWGIHIQDENGLTQSGGVAENIWKTPLNKIKKQKIKYKIEKQRPSSLYDQDYLLQIRLVFQILKLRSL